MSTFIGKLFLIPTMLGSCSINSCIPPYNIKIINSLSYFIVEEERSAYKLLRNIGFTEKFDNITFYQLNEHSKKEDIVHYLDCTDDNNNIGLFTEAGLPCIADPGSIIVRMAHQKGIQVVPLVGPTSIIAALISSGMNGQNFAFHGYLPVKSPFKENKIIMLEKNSAELNQTQIFIEAPYRNIQLFNTIINICMPATLLSIATNINCSDEYIRMKSIEEWETCPIPDINKKPTVFCLYSNK